MRSKHHRELISSIAELNNHLSHYYFVWDQFNIDNAQIISNNPEKFTTEVYSSNKMAPQFHVRLDSFVEKNSETHLFILKSLFLLSFAHYEEYQRNLYSHCRVANPALDEIKSRDTLPDKIFEYMGLGYEASFTDEERLTFSYLKLRRNQIMHGGGASKGEIKDLIRQKGTSLNRYWEKRLTNGIHGIDFTSDKLGTFTFNEIVDVINIIKVLSFSLDSLILSAVNTIELLVILKNEFMEKNKKSLVNANIDRIKLKFTTYCKIELGHDVSKDELDQVFLRGA